jgi:hypothetical protein
MTVSIQQGLFPRGSHVLGEVLCHRRDIVLAGGYTLAGPSDRLDMVRSSRPIGAREWQVVLEPHPANGGVINSGSVVRAVCLSDNGYDGP